MTDGIVERHVAPGDADYLESTWRLKERIRRDDGVLSQRRRFFDFQYRRCTVYLFLRDEAPVAFAVVRADGYLSLLGVHPEYRRRGLGRRLIARVAEGHDQITCHTRADNGEAVAFYTDLGFVVRGRIGGYYRDGTDAYQLELSDDGEGRLERILNLLD